MVLINYNVSFMLTWFESCIIYNISAAENVLLALRVKDVNFN